MSKFFFITISMNEKQKAAMRIKSKDINFVKYRFSDRCSRDTFSQRISITFSSLSLLYIQNFHLSFVWLNVIFCALISNFCLRKLFECCRSFFAVECEKNCMNEKKRRKTRKICSLEMRCRQIFYHSHLVKNFSDVT